VAAVDWACWIGYAFSDDFCCCLHLQVWSKLQEGRMPTAAELLTAMDLPGMSPASQE
jgi:hypothetical protein